MFKAKLVRIENVLLWKVLRQSGKVCTRGQLYWVGNGAKIVSTTGCPDICGTIDDNICIAIRGELKAYDKIFGSYSSCSSKEATKLYSKVIIALKAFCKDLAKTHGKKAVFKRVKNGFICEVRG